MVYTPYTASKALRVLSGKTPESLIDAFLKEAQEVMYADLQGSDPARELDA